MGADNPSAPIMPPVRRVERCLVWAVTAAFAIVLVLWAAVVPAFQAPDESTHFDAAVHVALGDGWHDPGTMKVLRAVSDAASETGPDNRHAGGTPTLGEALDATGSGTTNVVDQMTQHPPTYYVIAAGVLHLVDFRSLVPAQAVFALRLLGALFVLPLPALAWATVRRVTRSPRAALVGGFAVLAVPQLASIGASVSNDPPVMLFAATTIWLTTRVLTGDRRARTTIELALSLGIALLWKGTALPLIPFVAVAMLLPDAARTAFRTRLLRTICALAIAAVVGAFWWARNLLLFHTLQPDGFTSLRPDMAFPAGTGPDPIAFANVSWTTIARTFWGSFGGKAQWVLSPIVFESATVLALAAIVIWAFRRKRGLWMSIAIAVLPATIFVSQTSNAWSSYTSSTVIGATQGRYYFPAMVAFIALSAIAWRRAIETDRGHRRFSLVVSAVAAALSVYAIWFVYASVAEHSRLRLTSRGLATISETATLPVPVLVTLWIVGTLLLAATLIVAHRAIYRLPRAAVPSDLARDAAKSREAVA